MKAGIIDSQITHFTGPLIFIRTNLDCVYRQNLTSPIEMINQN